MVFLSLLFSAFVVIFKIQKQDQKPLVNEHIPVKQIYTKCSKIKSSGDPSHTLCLKY